MYFDFAGLTDVGVVRENNEDAWWAGGLVGELKPMDTAASGRALSDTGVLLAVSDGLGGASAGEVASHMSVDTVVKTLSSLPRGQASQTNVVHALKSANEALVAAGTDNVQWMGMGATMSFLWAEEGGAFFGQVGDSRIYRWRAGRLFELSPDHSPVGRMRQSGQLTESEARRHPRRHVIDQCLGGGESTLSPDCEAVDVLPGDLFLLCTDGLTDGVTDQELGEALAAAADPASDLGLLARRMVDLANKVSGRDNVSVVIARCGVASVS